MSKKDRYSHLGDDTDSGTDAPDADSAENAASSDEANTNDGTGGQEVEKGSSEERDGIRVTLSDGSEKVAVRIEDEGLTIDDLEDNIEDLFDDSSQENADDDSIDDVIGRAQSYLNGPLPIYPPLTHGVRTSRYLMRAMIRSGNIGMNPGAAWMTAFLRHRRRED